MEMVLQPMLQWIPIWYDVKLAIVAWLVLPQFRGAAFIYEKFVREKLINKYGARYFRDKSPPPAPAPAKKSSQIILAIGTKLQAVLTRMTLDIKERHVVVQGISLVYYIMEFGPLCCKLY